MIFLKKNKNQKQYLEYDHDVMSQKKQKTKTNQKNLPIQFQKQIGTNNSHSDLCL